MSRSIGLLVPASDTVMEPDLWRRLPLGLALYTTRMYLESTTVEGEERMLREEVEPAARRIACSYPELVIFGATSASALHGIEGDRRISSQISTLTGSPCMTVIQTVIYEFHLIGAKRVLLITPYVDGLNVKLKNTLASAGVNIVHTVGLGLHDDRAIAAVEPEAIQKLALERYAKEMAPPDGIFISCTTFRGLDAAEGLERELGIPVLSSNLCVLKSIYRHFQMVYPAHALPGH